MDIRGAGDLIGSQRSFSSNSVDFIPDDRMKRSLLAHNNQMKLDLWGVPGLREQFLFDISKGVF
jgi:hypothetical protein